ncbi:MAG: polysaccharide deacetylase family protein [Oscillospiraceae bacterium]|nr:polysaccharide deacetylase family protein [Oscillospiraceae bacterium]
MFFVVNKDKIVSCAMVIAIVFSMLFVANTLRDNRAVIQTAGSIRKELPIYSVNTNEPKVALTINSAWHADDIDMILEILEKHGVNITFFMVGDWVERFPEAVKRIHGAGHEIANHSDTHPHVSNLNHDRNVEEIQRASERVKAITGEGTRLYRPPYGEYNDTVIKAARTANHIAIQWSIDTLDYKSLTRRTNVAKN